jgi:PAS domain S-box-containing protein
VKPKTSNPKQRSRTKKSGADLTGDGLAAFGLKPILSKTQSLHPADIHLLQQVELLRQIELLEALRVIDRVVLTSQSIDELGRGVLAQLTQIFQCSHAMLSTVDYNTQELQILSVNSTRPTRLHPGWSGQMQWSWENGFHPISIPDLTANNPANPYFQALIDDGIRAFMAVPVHSNHQMIGLLAVGTDNSREWVPGQLETMEEIGQLVSSGIERIGSMAQLEIKTTVQEILVTKRTNDWLNSQAQFQAVFEQTGLGLALIDMRGRIINSNPAFHRIYRCIPGDLHERTVFDFLRSDADRPRLQQTLKRLVREGHLSNIEFEQIACDGTIFSAQMCFSLIHGVTGSPEVSILIVEDFTEQKKNRAALVQAEKLAVSGKMAASLAHEINNPLQSAIGCLGLIKEVIAEGGDPARYIQVATEELERAARILTQMRDLHLKSGPDAWEEVDLNTLIDQSLTLISKKCIESNIQVDWEPGANLPLIKAAPDRLRQALLNLVLNAIDAMPEGGTLNVSVKVSVETPGASIIIHDTGSGIEPGLLDHIFDPFFTTKNDGMGLGLYLTRAIIEDHGGSIQAGSIPGQETIFTVWLPVNAQPEGANKQM